jgi:hypothetical protein
MSKNMSKFLSKNLSKFFINIYGRRSDYSTVLRLLEHVKNPGRVAWGKKLARMSRELKEEKKASVRRST